MSQTQFDPIDTAAAILDAFNAHDLNAIMDFFADDCSLDMRSEEHTSELQSQ